MSKTNRRELLRYGLAAVSAGVPATAAKRKFTMAFTPGSIGVKADQARAIELAAKYGFESVQPYGAQLMRDGAARHVNALKAKRLQWAAAGLPVEYRKDQAAFSSDMKKFPAEVKALHDAGVTRMGTWLRPSHASLTYLQNLKQTAGRLREIAEVLEDHGMRFGLEYVGTKRNWTAGRHAFVHTMAETKELIAEIGKSNVGFVLDTWHWWTARETADDILTLTNDVVVSCDLNDAPKGLEREEQYDNKRELPVATGMIDVKSFLDALVKLGYDGPIRPEPFNQPLRDMDDERASRVAGEAMKKAFALVG